MENLREACNSKMDEQCVEPQNLGPIKKSTCKHRDPIFFNLRIDKVDGTFLDFMR